MVLFFIMFDGFSSFSVGLMSISVFTRIMQCIFSEPLNILKDMKNCIYIYYLDTETPYHTFPEILAKKIIRNSNN